MEHVEIDARHDAAVLRHPQRLYQSGGAARHRNGVIDLARHRVEARARSGILLAVGEQGDLDRRYAGVAAAVGDVILDCGRWIRRQPVGDIRQPVGNLLGQPLKDPALVGQHDMDRRTACWLGEIVRVHFEMIFRDSVASHNVRG
ncbi:hypothetical protein [Polymorphobacter multimanifer]|uniref:hypothetical protein n=1 Tax=Polymorphobacter multimanifer TaxID=1070431 RepID=UPI001FB0C100|nr:hypothetical protein [Polymorphobacter multimanifer]